ncbi:MAG: T9SS type A sorting domain-containing protein [Bacteroidales bacterium]|nr:T9SS type A sorting domain-containing protein [Bacteroidales bacterium]
MYKLKEMILMLCLILSGALCYVHGEDRTENEKGEGIPIEVIGYVSVSGVDRGNSINPTLDGHFLIVVFNENLGQVSVEVATTLGATVESLSVYTPNGVQIYIPNTGNYIVTFTLSNGDVYAGEFTVTD